jgi:8-oxo-dGTP pyrophosphatase MutT (NUDIX family)
MEYSIYYQQPQDFKVDREAAGCYLVCQNKILFLKRHPNCSQGNTWGVPAGKLEKGESPKEAVIREIREEVGLDISQDITDVGKLFISLSHVLYVFHMFYKCYQTFPEIALSIDESIDARWVTYDEALDLPLIIGGKEALEYCQSVWSC